jgi:hypothetical protein
MRGIYWLKMPICNDELLMKKKLPDWFWTGKTKMNCLKDHQSIFEFCLRTPHPAVNDYWKFCAFGWSAS